MSILSGSKKILPTLSLLGLSALSALGIDINQIGSSNSDKEFVVADLTANGSQLVGAVYTREGDERFPTAGFNLNSGNLTEYAHFQPVSISPNGVFIAGYQNFNFFQTVVMENGDITYSIQDATPDAYRTGISVADVTNNGQVLANLKGASNPPEAFAGTFILEPTGYRLDNVSSMGRFVSDEVPQDQSVDGNIIAVGSDVPFFVVNGVETVVPHDGDRCEVFAVSPQGGVAVGAVGYRTGEYDQETGAPIYESKAAYWTDIESDTPQMQLLEGLEGYNTVALDASEKGGLVTGYASKKLPDGSIEQKAVAWDKDGIFVIQDRLAEMGHTFPVPLQNARLVSDDGDTLVAEGYDENGILQTSRISDLEGFYNPADLTQDNNNDGVPELKVLVENGLLVLEITNYNDEYEIQFTPNYKTDPWETVDIGTRPAGLVEVAFDNSTAPGQTFAEENRVFFRTAKQARTAQQAR